MTADQKKKIIARIQKLMMRTEERGATANEAEASLAEVQRLLMKYQLDVAEVEGYDCSDFDPAEVRVWERPGDFAAPFINELMNKYYFVRVIRRSKYAKSDNINGYYFFGDKHHVTIASCVFIYLRRVYEELWREYKAETGAPKAHCRAYYAGLTRNLSNRLKRDRDKFAENGRANNALVVVDNALTEQFYKKYPTLKPHRTTPIRGQEAYQQGLADGDKIRLNKNLEDSSPRRPKLG